jgi:hypothetical protein
VAPPARAPRKTSPQTHAPLLPTLNAAQPLTKQCQFLHFHAATGLFIGQFGVPCKSETNASYPTYIIPGQSGNAFSPTLARATDPSGAPALYLYHNDEASHDGVGADALRVLRAEP